MSSRSVRFIVPFTAVMIVLMGSARTMSQVPASTSLPQTADGQPAIHGFWWSGTWRTLFGFAGSDSQKRVIVDPADGGQRRLMKGFTPATMFFPSNQRIPTPKHGALRRAFHASTAMSPRFRFSSLRDR